MNVRILATSCSLAMCVASSAAAADDKSGRLVEVLGAAAKARESGDYARAADLYQQSIAIFAASPEFQNSMGQLAIAGIRMEIATTMTRGQFGDACQQLVASKTALERARAMPDADKEPAEASALADISQKLAGMDRHLGCGVVPVVSRDPGQSDAALAGHYYLSGVRETGSELMLRPDGSFEWFMSYGAVDQFAKGHWGRKGQIVSLVPDRPKSGAALFRADSQEPWNSTAEDHLQQQAYTRRVDEMTAQCPLVAMPDFVSTPMAMGSDQLDPQAPARAAAGLAKANTARLHAEQTAAAAIAPGTTPARMDAAKAAMAQWQSARVDAENLYELARLPMPRLDRPHLPPQCSLPPEPSSKNIPAARWQRGIAVVVGDPAKEMRLSNVEVTFTYGDGTHQNAVTNNGGWAIAPLRAGQSVIALDVAMREPLAPRTHLAISPMREGIQQVVVDTVILTGPPFDEMKLTLDGEDLVATDLKRGRYSRH